MPVRDIVGEREAEAVMRPARTMTARVEPAQHPLRLLRPDPGTGVADGQDHVPPMPPYGDPHLAVSWCVVDRVVDQRDGRAADRAGRAEDQQVALVRMPPQPHAGLLGVGSRAVRDVLRDLGEIDRLVALGAPRVGGGEQVVDDLAESLRVLDDAVGVAQDLVARAAAAQGAVENLGPRAQQRQRCAQLMARIGHERPLQGERLGQRPDCATADQDAQQPGEQQTERRRESHRLEQAGALLMRRRQIEHSLHRLALGDPGGDAVLAVVVLHRGQPDLPGRLRCASRPAREGVRPAAPA